LVLLDLNMPGVGGLETLSAIKSDPELYVIPVIVFSSSSAPDDVRESYRARANCFVQKPIDLERSLKLLQTIETFWLDFVLLPPSGKPIASLPAEASSRKMSRTDYPENKKIASHSGCTEHNRLLDEFGKAVRELLGLHEEQFLAIIDGDGECSRFDLLIHMANEHKQLAKYAYLRHVEAHGCSKT
jgi:CheY-like chemotaxis protein